MALLLQESTSDQFISALTPPNDAFWDRQNTDASSSAADARVKLLQPAHASSLTPGPHSTNPPDLPSGSSQGAMQSPFGAASAAHSRNSADASQSEQAQVREVACCCIITGL